MKSKYMKIYEITKEKYIGVKSYVFGKELYCYVDLVENGEIKSKSRNKIYETGKGKYIEKGRKRYYIEERRNHE